MDWFDPSDDVVISPHIDRSRFWHRKYGVNQIDIARQVLFVNNGHGRLFDRVCQVLDQRAEVIHDQRSQGYCHYQALSGAVTVYRAPEPAPYAAADLEFVISAGAEHIVFVNGAGSLRADVGVGSILLPGELVREEGASFHYVPPEEVLCTNSKLNRRIATVAEASGVELIRGRHWTTDAIYRETFSKVEQYGQQGVNSVDMELSALVGVAVFRKCALSAILVVTDVVSRNHTWDGTKTKQFEDGVQQIARVAANVFPCALI